MARPMFGKPKPKADLGAPSDFGPPPAPRGKAGAPPMIDPDQDQDIDTDTGPDPDQDQDTGGPTVTPEAVSYRTAEQQCNSCEYMGEDGNCAVLKMPVEENSSCNAHKAGAGEVETRGRLRGDYGGGGGDTGDMGG